jgi:hypothetical protein
MRAITTMVDKVFPRCDESGCFQIEPAMLHAKRKARSRMSARGRNWSFTAAHLIVGRDPWL